MPCMRHGRLAFLVVFCLLMAVSSASAADNSRYALANGCYALTSAGQPVPSDVGPFRMKATALGSYMLYGKKGDFLAKTGATSVGSAATPSDQADWTVDGTTGAFTVTLAAAKQQLAYQGGQLTLVPAGQGTQFGFAQAADCAIFPESEVDVQGAPSKAASPYGVVKGLLDAHMHWMAFEFLGGKAHCGKPWDRFGITVALVDCPDHSIPGSPGNVLEAALGGPVTHDTVGWPTFNYWPNYYSETHENTYYKWVERAWRGGLRLFVNLYVDNAALCKVYPEKSHDCNEMDTVRLEMQQLHELQNYVDAQNGGPGKGWFQIVKTPFEARKVIAEGKLAIVQGIEVSELFDCTIYNLVPNCDKKKVDDQLQAVYDAGVRDMELVNKFDNAFVGVAGDNGTQGVIVNNGNRLEDGRYWDMKTCQGLPDGVSDKAQITPFQASPQLGAFFTEFMPSGEVPVYPAGPLCNQLGLSPLGVYLEEKMMDKGMIIDPDHMSVSARNATLDLLEAHRYSGVVSSHSWSTPDAYPRIYKLGGIVTPIGSNSTSFVKDWKTLRPERDKRYYFGFGWGADMNGFHSSGAPRPDAAKDPVVYPFKSFDGKQTISRLTTGKRTWDINKDGVANYGLYPDWVEDLRKVGGDKIVNDMARGSEAYLEMWERAVGVPVYRPVPSRSRFTPHGLFRVGLGMANEELLRSAGQPGTRGSFVWRWGIQKRNGNAGHVYAVIGANGHSTLIASTGAEHSARGVNVGDAAARVKHASRSGSLLVTSAGGGSSYVYGVRGGKVRFVGVTSLHGAALRAAVHRTGLA
ncbi:MAG: hypothetical protein JWM71_2453 [Solirubrobacteraceae bacterium]|nr:hypothetical protein [Solirubrobacteraceae bacterium]